MVPANGIKELKRKSFGLVAVVHAHRTSQTHADCSRSDNGDDNNKKASFDTHKKIFCKCRFDWSGHTTMALDLGAPCYSTCYPTSYVCATSPAEDFLHSLHPHLQALLPSLVKSRDRVLKMAELPGAYDLIE